MDLNLVISLVTFFGILKAHQLGWLHWVAAALLTVVTPFIITRIIIGLVAQGAIDLLWLLFSAKVLVTLALQLVAAFFIFRLIKDHDESFATWFFTAIFGFIALYLLVPYIVQLIIH